MKKHSLIIYGHPTSISLEPLFFEELKRIAVLQKRSIASLVEEVDKTRKENLSSALRLYVLTYIKNNQ